MSFVLENGDVVESLKNYRTKFPRKGDQQRWLLSVPLTLSEVAKLCACSERTVRDYRRGKFSIKYDCFTKLCNKLDRSTSVAKPEPLYFHVKEAGRKGGATVIKKYGRVPVNESKRLKRWKHWWETTGQKITKITIAKSIRKPRKSRKLAEFVGVMLGDGSISDYQVKVTLHAIDDKRYGQYVVLILQELFDVHVSVKTRKNVHATDYVVSRRELVKFCTVELGLVKGNKIRQAISIPKWIKDDKGYSLACVRGLMDTDGSVFMHRYMVRGKRYGYKKLSFSSASPRLCDEVAAILQDAGLSVSRHKRNVRIEDTKSVGRYFDLIGSHNPKHLKRYLK